MATNEDALDWEEIDKIRKATKGCLTILKEKINKQFEKKKVFDMSFGIGQDEEDSEANKSIRIKDNKFQQYKEKLNQEAEIYSKKREESLMIMKQGTANIAGEQPGPT